jgi:ribosome-associated translation inhibitor RaiA
MKISFSHIEQNLRESVEKVIEHHIQKLEKLLQHYSPDSIKMHGDLEHRPRKSDFNFSLNLTLPTGTLHATAIASDAPASVRTAFFELEGQVKKHQAKVRKDYEWKRKRGRALRAADVAPATD